MGELSRDRVDSEGLGSVPTPTRIRAAAAAAPSWALRPLLRRAAPVDLAFPEYDSEANDE